MPICKRRWTTSAPSSSAAEWTDINRNALDKFRRFLLHERGQVESHIHPYDPALHTAGLPAWLVEQLTRYQHVKQRNWREARIEEGIRRFWCGHLRVWRFLVERCQVSELSDIKRSYFSAFIDWRLEAGASVRSVNGDLRSFHGFMAYLQDQNLPVPHVLLRLRCLKEPDPLPHFLTDEQVRAMRDDLEQRIETADQSAHLRDALLDRACFYLLWQAALRRGEVEDLRLEDLDLAGRRLTVRRGKGQLDRTVFLTDTVVRALKAYLEVRGPGPNRSCLPLPQPGPLQRSHPRPAQSLRRAGEGGGVCPSSQAHLRHPATQCGLPHHLDPEVLGA